MWYVVIYSSALLLDVVLFMTKKCIDHRHVGHYIPKNKKLNLIYCRTYVCNG